MGRKTSDSRPSIEFIYIEVVEKPDRIACGVRDAKDNPFIQLD
jgi:hypothetical protein